jgi:hypothetical protein
LARLLMGIQHWESAAAKAGLTGEGVKRRVAGNVEWCLGTPTGRILQSVTTHCGNLLSTIEPVLALVLGRKAASSLVSSIGVSLVLLGELGLLLAAYYCLPWPWNSLVWYISLPASCAFALAPAYRLETIFQAVTGGRRNPEVPSST